MAEPEFRWRRHGLNGVRRTLALSKRDLLFFDAIMVMGLERQLEEVAHTNRRLAADAAFLVDKGFLLEGPDTVQQLKAFEPEAVDGYDLNELRELDEQQRNALEPHLAVDILTLLSGAGHPSSASLALVLNQA